MEQNVIESDDNQNIVGAEGMRDENINISDVIEVIETDPDFRQSTTTTTTTNMYNGGRDTQQQQQQQQQQRGSGRKNGAYVKIVEQPASKALRFRYECEGRSAGSIPGMSSTPENKTFPTIKIFGYTGKAVVVVSCVTKDPPYRPHPHSLVGREGCRRGVCTLEVSPDTMTVIFSNLGIQCVKKKDIEAALRAREEIRVDPFRTGFSHRNQPTSIDLNAVRLCFQVFLEGERGKFTVPLQPVVSDIIYDKKAMCDLVIVKLSHCVCPVDGGRTDIVLLCEKVAKEDIQVRFFEETDSRVTWEAFGDFQPSHVHKQTGIWFRPPRYRTLEVTEPVRVFIQLRRPSDGATSEPLPFEYLPLDSDRGKRKRQKFESDPGHVIRRLSEQERGLQLNFLNIPMETVKVEPRDTTPSPYGGQMYSPIYASNAAASPQYGLPVDLLGHTPPPPDLTYPLQFQQQQHQQHQVSTAVAASMEWAAPPSSSGANAATNDLNSASGISSLLNLDNQQLVPQFNSQELASYALDQNLSETFSGVSLTDVAGGAGAQPDQNMTDSLTRLAIDNICQLNEMP